MLPDLTREEFRRYARQIQLPDIGVRGQQKLKAASVLVVGAGGLGSPVCLYLAAAGVGRIGIVDGDVVDHTNLQRQVIHGTRSEGTPKVISAKTRMLDVNPDITVDTYPVNLCADNAEDIGTGYDIFVDGTDNIPSRYLLNDLAVLQHKPYVYASIYQFEGQVSVFSLADGPCYRCLFPEPPPAGTGRSCAQTGVLGILPGTIGTIEATEVIKLITGVGDPLSGRLLLYDAREMSSQQINIHKREDCRICGAHPEITHLTQYPTVCADFDLPAAGGNLDIPAEALADFIQSHPGALLVDVREEFELNLAQIPGAVNIPPGEIEEHLADLLQAPVVVLFCRNGTRSANLTRKLAEDGHANIRNLRGGINAWITAADPHQLPY